VATAYGVLSQRGFANRWTFYIDKAGVIREIDKSVKAQHAGPDVAAKVKELKLAPE
jgi:peroxiredoxin